MVSGNYAYLANNTDGVRIYDVSTPSNPINVAVATNIFGAYSRHIVLSGNHAFVANSFDGVRIHFLGVQPSSILGINRASNTVKLSWPAPSAALELQHSSDLNAVNWMTLTNASEVVELRNQVIIPQGMSNRFYRLKSP